MNSTPQKHPSQSTQDSSTSSSRDTRDQNGMPSSPHFPTYPHAQKETMAVAPSQLGTAFLQTTPLGITVLSPHPPTPSFWLKTVSLLSKVSLYRLTIPGNFGDQSWPAQSTGSSSNSTNAADSKAWSTAVNIGSVAGGVVNRSKKQSAGGSAGTGGKGK